MIIPQLAQLKKYPVFLKETLLQIYAWVVISALFYGFNYSWSSFGKSLYESYVFAGKFYGVQSTNVLSTTAQSTTLFTKYIPSNWRDNSVSRADPSVIHVWKEQRANVTNEWR